MALLAVHPHILYSHAQYLNLNSALSFFLSTPLTSLGHILPFTATECKRGYLQLKTTTVLGRSSWKQAFFELQDTTLHQFNNEVSRLTRQNV